MVPVGRAKASPCRISLPLRLTRRSQTRTAGSAGEAGPRSAGDNMMESGEPLTFFIM